MSTPHHHRRAVQLHGVHVARLEELADIDLGIIRWCVDLIADQSPLQAASTDPRRGSGSTESHPPPGTFATPDPLLDAAQTILDWISGTPGKVSHRDAASALRRIRGGVAPGALTRPCDVCGRTDVAFRRDGRRRSDTCEGCRKAASREMTRTG